MSNSVIVIHFQPLEYYPPVCNFLNSVNTQKCKYFVFTTHNGKDLQNFSRKGINILRIPASRYSKLVNSMVTAIIFNIVVFFKLLVIKPKSILYYETSSSFPAAVYRIFFTEVTIAIHCHEYFTPYWYKHAGILIRLFHKLEKSLFLNAKWISHTNADRLKLFFADNAYIKPGILKVLPNYPPSNWQNVIVSTKTPHVLKIVYVGALSFTATYIKEFCEWVLKQMGKVNFDIYCYNAHKDVDEYLTNIDCYNITYFKNGIEYNELPQLLRKYDIGVILYKGLTPNFKFNAPNKLFEYLVNDLDVWFPIEMEGCYHFVTNRSIPSVSKIDFRQLDKFDIVENIDKSGFVYKPVKLFCEDVYIDLENALL